VTNNLLTQALSEPLNDTTTATVDINSGIGNLTINTLSDDEHELASGTLQYFEKEGAPTRSLESDHGRATLKLSARRARRSWLRIPWAGCGAATEWQIHLNPMVSSDITAHTDGGNVKLDLAALAVSRVSADTGGGNMHVVLPDNAADLAAVARTGGGNVTVEIGDAITGSNALNAGSGAGNVVVRVPSGVAARVHATSGLGRVSVEPRFNKVGANSYQSPEYETATSKVEITLSSGAGNVIVSTK
jgi:hypothetical protein